MSNQSLFKNPLEISKKQIIALSPMNLIEGVKVKRQALMKQQLSDSTYSNVIISNNGDSYRQGQDSEQHMITVPTTQYFIPP